MPRLCYKSVMTAFFAMLLKPLVAIPFLLIAYAGKRLVERMPDCKLKRVLLFSWKA